MDNRNYGKSHVNMIEISVTVLSSQMFKILNKYRILYSSSSNKTRKEKEASSISISKILELLETGLW